jgi:carbon-monoxide dehydrogenase small subunit
MTELTTISVTINGTVLEINVAARTSLADMLRQHCKLTGTHVGCEHGVCGACTVQIDGVAVRSCLMFAVQVDGKDVRTVEGLATGQDLHPLQTAFHEYHGLQCGFCTPGILMTLEEFLREIPAPTEEDVREALSGNICRCTGYQAIVDATLAAVPGVAAFNGAQAKES